MLTKEERNKLLQYSEFIVKRYYRFYKNKFKLKAIDINDLQQEGYIIVLKIIDKFQTKPFDEIKKIMSQAVGWKFCVILKSIDVYSYSVFDENIFPILETKEGVAGVEKRKPNMLFEDIKNLLGEREYRIIFDRFMNHDTYKRIGLKEKISTSYVKYLIDKSFLTIRKNLFPKKIL